MTFASSALYQSKTQRPTVAKLRVPWSKSATAKEFGAAGQHTVANRQPLGTQEIWTTGDRSLLGVSAAQYSALGHDTRTLAAFEVALHKGPDPIVHFLEVLRETQGRDPHIHPGDMIWESEISEAVRANSRLERTLNEMREISGSRTTDSSIDRVRRVLEQLVKAGYIVETNAASKGYQVTGKVQYLYQLLNFINENTPLLSDDGVVDSIDTQLRLDVPDGERSGLQSP